MAIVGALACQRHSYWRELVTTVVACTPYRPEAKANGKAAKTKTTGTSAAKSAESAPSTDSETSAWLVECADSVIFPEGGGQHSDTGSLHLQDDTKIIPVLYAERQGLRCLLHTPEPLALGQTVRQVVDFRRRWDHMQQHTGQHLLSAVMDRLPLETLGWGMGKYAPGIGQTEGMVAEEMDNNNNSNNNNNNQGKSAGTGINMNYVDLPRRPTDSERQFIQNECNRWIREAVPVTVETPELVEDHKVPGDYDVDQGVIRVVCMGELDRNPCCGTHLANTAHVNLLLVHHVATVNGRGRMFFTAGDRALRLATDAIQAAAALGRALSLENATSNPAYVANATQQALGAAQEGRKREGKLLAEIAQLEAANLIRRTSQGSSKTLDEEPAARKMQSLGLSDGPSHGPSSVVVHYRKTGGAEYLGEVAFAMKDYLADPQSRPSVFVLAAGEERKAGGPIMVLATANAAPPKAKDSSAEGSSPEVYPNMTSVVQRIQEILPGIRGGGKGKWQGKVAEWRAADVEALQAMET